MLVSRISFKFYKRPRENQKIILRTWEEKARALQCMRRYDICDAITGDILVTESSSWLIVDPETRRIQKPSVFTSRPLPEKETPFAGIEPGKIHHSENEKLLDERTIRYSDIDANGHANNSRYGDFFADALPPEFHKKTITDFRLNYAKECREGDVLKIFGEVSEDNTKITMTGKIEATGEVCFEAEAFFE
jgi:acyl-ACP thioesterase